MSTNNSGTENFHGSSRHIPSGICSFLVQLVRGADVRSTGPQGDGNLACLSAMNVVTQEEVDHLEPFQSGFGTTSSTQMALPELVDDL